MAHRQIPALVIDLVWDELFQDGGQIELERILPGYLRERRWFRGKARQIRSACLLDHIPIAHGNSVSQIALVGVIYDEGEAETYVLPLAFATGARAEQLLSELPHAVIAYLQIYDIGEEGVLYDPTVDRNFCKALLALAARRRRIEGRAGELAAPLTEAFQKVRGGDASLEPIMMSAEQSNTSVIYGDRMILKIFRRLEAGVNPDLEIGRFLTEQRDFANISPVAGAIEYRPSSGGESMTLGILQGFVPNQGDAWQYTLGELTGYFERVRGLDAPPPDSPPISARLLLELADTDPLPPARALIGGYLDAAQLLGRRTAELHLALAATPTEPGFTPEPFTSLYQRTIEQSMRAQVAQIFPMLRQALRQLHGPACAEARQVLDQETAILDRFGMIRDRPISAMRTRYHGDYHLGQVLFTGDDFTIIDFEGEPARPLNERRVKRSPLRDVTGMLRSFRYAAHAALLGRAEDGHAEDAAGQAWADSWSLWVSVAFLRAYLATAGQAIFVPKTRAHLEVLLDIFLLDKAVYELGYELNNRPGWVYIPLQGILQLLAKERVVEGM